MRELDIVAAGNFRGFGDPYARSLFLASAGGARTSYCQLSRVGTPVLIVARRRLVIWRR